MKLFKQLLFLGFLSSVTIPLFIPSAHPMCSPFDEDWEVMAPDSSAGSWYVSTSNTLCTAEKEALSNRFIKNNKALSALYGESLSQIPFIGIACSGGSNRAAIATLALLQAFELMRLDDEGKYSLLDAITYIATLSGSTWSTASWFYHDVGLADLGVFLRKQLNNPAISDIPVKEIKEQLEYKHKQGREIGINDIWASIVGLVYLGKDNILKAKLQDLYSRAHDGSHPIPLFSAIHGETDPYKWAEFSPFAIGSCYLSGWIVPEAFGKYFNNGISNDAYSGETLAYLMGLWGAFYAENAYDLINALREFIEEEFKFPIPIPFTWIWKWFWSKRISPPEVYSWVYQLSGHPLNKDKYLSFTDGGNAINVAVDPIFRRALPIIFVCDASGDCRNPLTNPMRDVYKYAQQAGKPMPPIDYNDLTTKTLSILYDEHNSSVPTIIYIPNLVSLSSTDFHVPPETFDELVNSMVDNILEHEDKIKDAIIRVIKNMKKNQAIESLTAKLQGLSLGY